MRVPALILVVALGLFLGVGVAAAEKVKSNQATKLYSRPGEQAKVLLAVKSGQSMQLLSKDGRWLKVRVKGRTGYVPRSKVDMADDGAIARNTRRRPFVEGRGKKRGFGGDGAPDDRVGADAMGDGGGGDEEEEEEEDEPPPKKKVVAKAPAKDEEDEEEEEAPPPKKKVAAVSKPPAKDEEEDEEDEEERSKDDEGDEEEPITDEKEEVDARPRARVSKKVAVYDEPDEESDSPFSVRPTDTLFPGKTEGAWTFVENADGDGGWIQTDLLEMGESGGTSGKRVIDVRARAGIMIIQQGMRTAGSNLVDVPDNYNIGTSSVTIALGGGIMIPKGKYLFGGEMTYEYSKTLGGGVFYDKDKGGPEPGVNIGIVVHNVNVRGMAGIDLKKKSGMALFGRLGYRYQGFLVNDVANMAANPAQLPSEVVKGPTLGAAFAIPKLTTKIGLRFSLDTMLFGASITQTRGLEDGASPSVTAIVLGTGLVYRMKAFDLQAAYDLNYMGVDFGAPLASSTRVHMGTNVKRTDIFHQITFGVAKGF